MQLHMLGLELEQVVALPHDVGLQVGGVDSLLAPKRWAHVLPLARGPQRRCHPGTAVRRLTALHTAQIRETLPTPTVEVYMSAAPRILSPSAGTSKRCPRVPTAILVRCWYSALGREKCDSAHGARTPAAPRTAAEYHSSGPRASLPDTSVMAWSSRTAAEFSRGGAPRVYTHVIHDVMGGQRTVCKLMHGPKFIEYPTGLPEGPTRRRRGVDDMRYI